MNVKRDGHIHSHYCPHGSNDSFESYIKKAIEEEIEEITFTEHMPMLKGIVLEGASSDFLETSSPGIEEIDEYFKEANYYKEKYKNRTKPWGTGQAILCCRKVVKESFVVINADDYYGKEAFIKAYRYLSAERERVDTINICMIGFVLKNTLSDNGGVTRGICMVNEEGMLENIVETHNIEKRGNKAVVINGNTEKTINSESIVSMNMWGFKPDFFPILANEFEKFLSELCMTDLKSEFLLPTIIGEQLEKKKISVKVLQSFDEWFGVTYKEDKESVIRAIRKLIMQGVYADISH